MKYNKGNKKYFLLSFLLAAGIFSGCVSVSNDDDTFGLVEKNQKIKAGSIAVLAGSGDEMTIKIAESITRQLSEKSTFSVIEQKDITKLIPSYPVTFMEQEDLREDTWELSRRYLTGKNQAVVDAIQKVLKTEYILLVWAEEFNTGTTGCCILYSPWFNNYRILMYSRLVKYPSGGVIGLSKYQRDEDFNTFRSMNGSIDRLLDNASEDFADKMIKVTNTQKEQIKK